MDSDLELDELVPSYLKVKSKLYEIDPQLVESTSRPRQKNTLHKNAEQSHNAVVRKLLSQLQRITSDVLFDDREAEALWPALRNEIAKQKALQRQENLASSKLERNPQEDHGPSLAVSNQRESQSFKETVDAVAGEDEDDLLGDMFSAVPNEVSVPAGTEGTSSQNVVLRDFGKESGTSPRKLLEETIRSR